MSKVVTDDIHSDIASLQRLWQLAGPLRHKVAKGILFRALQSISLGVAFIVIAETITDLADGRSLTLPWICWIMALLALSLACQLLFGYLSAINSWLSSFNLAGQIRLSILDHLRHLPMGFHLSRHKGDTVAVLTSDMQVLENLLSDGLPRIAQVFCLPLTIWLFILWSDWLVALCTLIPIAVAMPVFFWSNRRLAALSILRQDLQADATAQMIEYVQGIAVIRAFNRIREGQRNFGAALADFRVISRRMTFQLTAPIVIFGVLLMMGIPMVMMIACLRYTTHALGIGTLISILMLVFSIYPVLFGMISVMEMMRIADASLTRIDRIMTATPLPLSAETECPDGFEIRFDQVDFSYQSAQPVLNTVSFTVPEKTMFAIVGPSGSGKSTTLNLLARFYDVNSGSISIGGVDICNIEEERLNQLMTVVFQDAYLFAGTILDNIAMGKSSASQSEIEAAARAAQAFDFITALPQGFLTLVGEGGTSLSGGERQRIALARAILKDAPIVLLDEATAAIDATTERDIQGGLARLVNNKTLIVVAHKLSTIRFADQILLLQQGRVKAQGDHETLVAIDSLYRQLWQTRNEATQWQFIPDQHS